MVEHGAGDKVVENGVNTVDVGRNFYHGVGVAVVRVCGVHDTFFNFLG